MSAKKSRARKKTKAAVAAAHTPNPYRIYRTNRLAQLLDVDPSTLWRWRKDGVLPEPLRIGGVVGWTEAQVAHLLKAEVQS